jgi:3-dehydroquinate synthase
LTQIKMPEYDILIQENGLADLGKHIKSIYSYEELFVVTDQKVYDLYHATMVEALKQFHVFYVVISEGETSKSLETYHQVIDTLIERGIKRNHLILALGGGVVGDLTGFVASTLYRGIPYMHIPTTLLAMVDSSIGGKVGIDLKQGKNLLGSFYQPKLVYIDTMFLKTLPQREYANGLAEMIKAGLIGDKKLYQYVLEHEQVTMKEIEQSIHVKRDVVLIDPMDYKERMILNFGHTFGHAIEKRHQYETYKHGEAISYGMLIALQLGINLGKTEQSLYDEVKALLIKRGLVKEPLLDMEDYKSDIIHDKKFLADGLNFIIVHKPGYPEIIKLKALDIL